MYVTTTAGKLIKLQYLKGEAGPTKIWEFAADTIITSSPIIGSNHEIYFGTHSGMIYSVNADGTQKWTYNAYTPVLSTGALAEYGTSMDRLFIGDSSGYAFALSLSDGIVKWIHGTGSSIVSAFLYDEGVVHFGTTDGKVLKIKDTEPMNAALARGSVEATSIWGTFQGNNYRTGNHLIYSDNVAPTILLTTTVTSPTDTSIMPITVTFSEDVTGFGSEDITVGNGTLSNFAGSESIYTFDITPIADGVVTVDIASGLCNDLAGNINAEANQLSINYSSALSVYSQLIPDDFELNRSYPNPFNPVTSITYLIPEIANISLTIYDMTGKEIIALYNGIQTPGYHTINWNASEQSSGIYFVQMIAGEYVNTQKLMLIK